MRTAEERWLVWLQRNLRDLTSLLLVVVIEEDLNDNDDDRCCELRKLRGTTTVGCLGFDNTIDDEDDEFK